MSVNPQYESVDVDPKDIDASLDEAQMVADDRKVEVLPEAPAVANVKVWIKGFGVMFTVRGEKLNDMIKKTTTLIDYAQSHEWKNRWDDAPAGVSSAVGHPTQPQDVSMKHQPTCPVHGNTTKWLSGVSKKTGNPYSFWSCSAKNADGLYCKAELTKPE